MNVLLSWFVTGIGVAAVATIVSRFIPSVSPAARHAFWWLVLAAILALPWMPHPGALLAEHPGTTVTSAAVGIEASLTSVTIPAPPTWLLVAGLVAWVLVASARAIRLVVNVTAIRRLARSARPLPSERAGRFHLFDAARVGSRSARVFVSDELRGACAVGYLTPTILISSDIVAVLDDEAIEAIVLHEYAHLQRYDDWTRLVQQVVIAVAGIHPAVRWVSKQIDIEREAACDRIVVSRTASPLSYGQALTAAAEIAGRMSGLTPLVAPGMSMSDGGLHARVRRLLHQDGVRPLRVWATTGAGAAALGMATFAAASLPPLVVVASIERPLLALSSVPLETRLVELLPAGAGAARVPVEEAMQLPERQADSAAQDPDTHVPTPPASGKVDEKNDVAPYDVPVGTNEAAVLDAASPIASLPLSYAIVPPRIGPASDADHPDQGGIGQTATQFGATTGDVAARAGTSIGRFFKNGGLAIANSF
jgi:beta-lactamase regulating signal transducer with metallopeptidase domain